MSEEILSSADSLALADSYLVDNELDLAIDAYAAAFSVLREGEEIVRFRALSHKAEALIRLGRYEEACEESQIALAGIPSGGLRTGETEVCHFRLGLALFEMGRFEESLRGFQQANQLASLNERDTKKYESYIARCQAELEPPVVVEEVPPRKVEKAGAPASKKVASTARAQAPSASPAPLAPATSAVAKHSSPSKTTRPKMPKYQYYQSDNVMTIAILEPNVKQEDLSVDFSAKRLTVQLRKQGVDFTVICGALYSEVEVSRCKVIVKDEKVLVKLRKKSSFEWHELMGRDDKESEETKTATNEESDVPTVEDGKPRAYASHRDWDAIERNLKEQEKQEKPEGDEALNKLFQDIYGRADEDTRRAMIKSYQTSGGTVLSTNWDEVSAKDYEKEKTAPKGMEWKNWEGEKFKSQNENDD